MDFNDTVESVISQGTLGIGFIGLAEALIALTGKHHGEDESAQKIGLQVIENMYKVVSKIKCVEMTLGEPDFVTPKNIQDAAIEAIQNGKASFYTVASGLPELKDAIKVLFELLTYEEQEQVIAILKRFSLPFCQKYQE